MLGNFSKFIAALAGLASVFGVAAADGNISQGDVKDIAFAALTAVLVFAFPANKPSA